MDKKWLIVLLVVALVFLSINRLGYFSNNDEDSTQVIEEEPIEEQDVVEQKTDDDNRNSEEETLETTDELISIEDISYDVEIIAENLKIPWDIRVLPDDRILITERPGNVILLEDKVVYQVHNVEPIGEGGLLGLELSPNFEQDQYVYLYYTYKENNQIMNKVSRFTFENDTFKDEKVILDQIPGSRFHNGGRMKFGPDGKLYITTGDAQDSDLAQTLESLAGKILRINSDGTIPADNPFDNSPIYAYGVRNPQGIAWHPETKELFSSGHGPSSQDEVNLIKPGKNYGWPIVTCRDGESDFEDPIACYSDFTLAPSGIDFLTMDGLLESSLFVAGLRGNMIMRLDFDEEGQLIRQEEMFETYGRLRTVEYHNGYLYILTNNTDGRGTPKENDDKVIKIKPVIDSSNE